MKICITRSERYAYSETFIRDQITGLGTLAEVYPIHSSRLPERAENGKLLSPVPFWVLHKIVKVITGKRNNFFGNYGLKKYLRTNAIEIVLANYGLAAAHMVPICKHLNIPLLAIFHGHDATDKRIIKEYAKYYEALFRYASAIIVVSNAMREHIIRMGANPSNIHVIACGVDVNRFTPSASAKEKKFLAVGRFARKKGPLHTIRAFHQVWLKHPDATLIMVGAHEGLYNACVALVEELQLGRTVTFTGILQQAEIQQHMNSALAYVQHSLTAPNGDMEGTPVSVLEASASALPVVSTFHGGIPDAVLHEKTGFLVQEADVNAMAAYMLRLIENPTLATTLGLNGRQHIEEHYTQLEQLKKIYRLAEHAVAQASSTSLKA